MNPEYLKIHNKLYYEVNKEKNTKVDLMKYYDDIWINVENITFQESISNPENSTFYKDIFFLKVIPKDMDPFVFSLIIIPENQEYSLYYIDKTSNVKKIKHDTKILKEKINALFEKTDLSIIDSEKPLSKQIKNHRIYEFLYYFSKEEYEDNVNDGMPKSHLDPIIYIMNSLPEESKLTNYKNSYIINKHNENEGLFYINQDGECIKKQASQDEIRHKIHFLLKKHGELNENVSLNQQLKSSELNEWVMWVLYYAEKYLEKDALPPINDFSFIQEPWLTGHGTLVGKYEGITSINGKGNIKVENKISFYIKKNESVEFNVYYGLNENSKINGYLTYEPYCSIGNGPSKFKPEIKIYLTVTHKQFEFLSKRLKYKKKRIVIGAKVNLFFSPTTYYFESEEGKPHCFAGEIHEAQLASISIQQKKIIANNKKNNNFMKKNPILEKPLEEMLKNTFPIQLRYIKDIKTIILLVAILLATLVFSNIFK